MACDEGLCLLSMSQFIPSLKPCDPDTCHTPLKRHEVVFFTAMYLIAVASGGYKPTIESFGADQFDENHPVERKKKMSFFNWWNFGLCSGILLGVTVIAYVADNVSWGAAFSILTSAVAITFLIFLIGRPFYRYQIPQGSPPMIQVIAAALAKRHLPHPPDAGKLYEVPESQMSGKRLLSHTNHFRFLDKAAIVEHADDATAFAAEKANRWRLATVTKVEEMKLILSTIPIWLTSLTFQINVAELSFFVKQGAIMDRRVFGGFQIPPASLHSFAAISMIITVVLYEKILEPFVRRARRSERGISILQRIGIGMALSTIAMAVAGLVERKRLQVAAMEQRSVVSMTVFWLVPQFITIGLADGFALVGLQEYFYDQVPDHMRSQGMGLYFGSVGVANFIGSTLITVVDIATKRGGRGWFAKDLNRSRLDNFYWLLAAISAASLAVYVYVASRYSYKSIDTSEREYGAENARV